MGLLCAYHPKNSRRHKAVMLNTAGSCEWLYGLSAIIRIMMVANISQLSTMTLSVVNKWKYHLDAPI